MAQLLLLLSAFLTFGLQITGALPEAKISGGTDVGQSVIKSVYVIRFHALIMEFGLYKCGGSIINRRSILTAASCVPEKNDPFAYTVIVGDVTMGNADGTEQAHVPIEIIHKEEYVPGSLESDIALLILSTSIDFNSYVNEVRIAQPGSEWYYNGQSAATICGWGDGGEGSRLQSGTATVSKKEVAAANCRETENVDSVLCVSSGACSKDLGGPLVAISAGEQVQIGIASKIENCSESGIFFGVFTEIAPYTTWIDSKIRDVDTAGKGHVSKVNTLLMILTASILIFFSC